MKESLLSCSGLMESCFVLVLSSLLVAQVFLCTAQDASHLSANIKKKLTHVPSCKTIEFWHADSLGMPFCWNSVKNLV